MSEAVFHSSWLQRKNSRRPSGTWTGFMPGKVAGGRVPAPLETWDALVAFEAAINPYTKAEEPTQREQHPLRDLRFHRRNWILCKLFAFCFVKRTHDLYNNSFLQFKAVCTPHTS